MLAVIGLGIEYRNCDVMLQLYKMLVGSRMEYYVQLWPPAISWMSLSWKKLHQDITKTRGLEL